MSNRVAFIDFVRGLLHINPLERWSPQQAKLHPFITQQKFTGPFVPPRDLKSVNRSPAPGTQQQMQAEAMSKQRAQAAQAAQVHSAAQSSYGAPMPMGGYSQSSHQQPPPIYSNNGNMYASNAPPPYPSQQGYNQQGLM